MEEDKNLHFLDPFHILNQCVSDWEILDKSEMVLSIFPILKYEKD